jgi:photosystem II stability/assembly factor-like uncharacterized protein
MPRPRHLALVISALLVLGACSSDPADDTSGAQEPSSTTSAIPDEPGEEGELGEGEEGEEEEGEEEEGEEAGDPDAHLPGADRGPRYPDDPFLDERLASSGAPSAGAFDAAAAQAATIQAQTAQTDPDLAAAAWKFLGPRTVGGRVVDAAVDPTNNGGVFVATSTAGLWHSTDFGDTYTSVWPDDVTHSMGAVAAAADGTIYAGTGETNPGGGSITYGGSGVYRSTDGGTNWTHIGLTKSGTIGRIVIDPNDSDRVWVAVSGNLFNRGGQRGVYLSTDGGSTWDRSLKPPNATTGAADIAMDPDDPDHLIAGLWDHRRKPGKRRYTGVGSGVWETKNGGDTWQRLGTSEGLPAPSEDTGRIGVAFAPSDADRVYAVYANNTAGSFQNFFTSSNGGRSWTRPAGADDLGGSQSTYGWWFARIFVDPENPAHLYLAGLNMYQSNDAAQNFTVLPGGLHADQHIAIWDTRGSGAVYIGNDGGFYASRNGGSSWTKSDDQPWSQYVSLDVSEQDPSRFLGGLQDNGTRASWTTPPFQDIIGGDGQRTLISPEDKETYYGCYQYGNCTGFSGGSQFGLPVSSDRFPFFMEMQLQPGNPDVMYAGGNKLNRSTNGGRSFTVVSDDLGHGGSDHGGYPFGTISAIGLSEADDDLVWVGTDNGYLYRSNDQGAHVTPIKLGIKPRPWITRITIDPADADSVYVTLSGYRSGDNSPYVLHSANAGKTWTDISGNLPKAPVNDLLVVGNRLYVGTDVGVFITTIGDQTWKSLGRGMPQQFITDLRYVPSNTTLYASTFGEGVWSIKR